MEQPFPCAESITRASRNCICGGRCPLPVVIPPEYYKSYRSVLRWKPANHACCKNSDHLYGKMPSCRMTSSTTPRARTKQLIERLSGSLKVCRAPWPTKIKPHSMCDRAADMAVVAKHKQIVEMRIILPHSSSSFCTENDACDCIQENGDCFEKRRASLQVRCSPFSQETGHAKRQQKHACSALYKGVSTKCSLQAYHRQTLPSVCSNPQGSSPRPSARSCQRKELSPERDFCSACRPSAACWQTRVTLCLRT